MGSKPLFNTSASVLSFVFITFICVAQSSSDIYPDLSCHPGYDANIMKEIHDNCTIVIEKEKDDFDFYCHKQCMLNYLNLYYPQGYEDSIDKKTGRPIYDHLLVPIDEMDPDEFEKPEDIPLRPLDEMLGKKLTEKLSKKVTDSCNDLMNEIANVQRLPCEKWGRVYDCVSKALKC